MLHEYLKRRYSLLLMGSFLEMSTSSSSLIVSFNSSIFLLISVLLILITERRVLESTAIILDLFLFQYYHGLVLCILKLYYYPFKNFFLFSFSSLSKTPITCVLDCSILFHRLLTLSYLFLFFSPEYFILDIFYCFVSQFTNLLYLLCLIYGLFNSV